MKPIITEANLQEGQLICQKLVQSMQQLPPASCMTGLAMALVFAADASDVALESVFQMCRELRKGFETEAKKREEAASKLIVVP